MIGNDVIDLELARLQSNWQRKGFLEKLFSNNEQHQIKANENPGLMVWIFWSCKEAAYKIYNRETRKRAFNPLGFECGPLQFSDGFYYGEVCFGQQTYYSKTCIDAQSVHTVAALTRENVDLIDDLLGDKDICKIDGLPFYHNKANGALVPVSVSDHGKFRRIVAFN